MKTTSALCSDIRIILAQARKSAYDGINSVMVQAYWNIGKRIVEEEQQGSSRGKYGEQILRNLADALTSEFGRGYSYSSLKNFRQFFLEFPNLLPLSGHEESPETKPNSIRYMRVANLQWSHYKLLMRVSDAKAREYLNHEPHKTHENLQYSLCSYPLTPQKPTHHLSCLSCLSW